MTTHPNPNGLKPLESKELYSWLAKYLIQRKEGERLLGVRQLAANAGTSVGSISSALNHLESTGAVRLERHGHSGSTVAERSISELWRVAEPAKLTLHFLQPELLHL